MPGQREEHTVCLRSALYGFFDRELSFHTMNAQLFMTSVSLKTSIFRWGGGGRGGVRGKGVPARWVVSVVLAIVS